MADKERETAITISEITSLADAFVKSGYFPDVKSQAQAIVKMAAGREMGLGPFYSMQKIYIIKGHPAVAAEAMAALIKRSGEYDYDVLEHTDEKCALEFTRGGEVKYVSTFTMEDARRAKLVREDSGWQTWPREMLFARALSHGARIVCPHLVAGATTLEAEGVMPGEEEKHAPEAAPYAGEPQVVISPPPAPKRDPVTVKTMNDLYRACHEDFGMQPAEVLLELGVRSQMELTELPQELYARIAEVKVEPPVSKKG
jgi:hypothetical protein